MTDRVHLYTSIDVRDRSYVLRHPVLVEIEPLADPHARFWLETPTLFVSGYGPTLEDAVRDYAVGFDHQYRGLVDVSARELADGATRVRNRLRAHVRAVVERS